MPTESGVNKLLDNFGKLIERVSADRDYNPANITFSILKTRRSPMKKRIRLSSYVLFALIFSSLFIGLMARPASTKERGPRVSFESPHKAADQMGRSVPEVGHDISPPLGDMVQVLLTPTEVGFGHSTTKVQEAMTARATDSGGILGAGISPATNGEVGSTQRVKIVNKAFQIFDNLTGTSVLGPADISTIWADFGGACDTNGTGDAVVLYDKVADRWVISQFASATGSKAVIEECFAVSTTGDATGSYYRYAFHLGGNFIDSPHLSVEADGYLMGGSVYDESGTERLGAQFFMFDRTAMLAGTAATFTSPGIDSGVGETYSISADGVRLVSEPSEITVSTLTINLTYDPDSTFTSAGLSAADIVNMKAANTYAASQFTNNFKDPFNVNIRVTAVPGTTTLGGSSTSISAQTFTTGIRDPTRADATTTDDATATGAGGSVPAGLADPIGGTHNWWVTKAQGKALNIAADDLTSDGTYTFGGGFSYTYDPNNRAVAGKYDYIGVSMHEISEIMGRIFGLGRSLGGNPGYLEMDLFHYTAANTRGLTDGAGRSFSFNNGTSLLKAFNNHALNGGDGQDWASGTNDAFNAFSNSGVKNDLTAVDLQAMDVIGYDFVGGGCSYTLNPTSQTFGSSGGSSSFSVTTGSTCSWTATVNAPASPEQWLSANHGNSISVNALDAQTKSGANVPEDLFVNLTPITINDRSSDTNPPGTASLYPSSITVSGMTGTITHVDVGLNGVSHTFPDDIDVILVGPGGQRAILMSDVGGNADLSGVDLIFEQSGAAMPDSTQVAAGTYRPTNYVGNANLEPGGVDNFPSPGPGQTNYPSDLDVFNGTSANGTWRLYVVDDEHLDSGNIANGWALGILTSGGGNSWINITSGSSGTGNGTVNYTVAANSGSSSRTGTITVNGQVHTVTQSGTGGGCTYSISSSENTVGPGTGSTNYFMDAPAGCTWSAVSDSPSWLTTSSSGSGDGTIRYDFISNPSTSSRTGRITAGGRVHTVTQIGIGGAGSVQFSSATYAVNEGGGTATITVTRSSGVGDGTVSYSTSNGTAAAGSDYQSASGVLLFAETVTSRTFDVPILDDTSIEGNETINLTLSNASTSLILGNPSTATLTIIDNDSSSLNKTRFDYDGDHKAEIGVYRRVNGTWYLINSSNGSTRIQQWGADSQGDAPVAGDFDGDGKTDIAVWRAVNGIWYIINSSTGSSSTQQWGDRNQGDIPTPGDFDGDSRTDVAVWRPVNGTWYILNSSNGSVTVKQWGAQSQGDKPVAADYDGDGKADVAVWRAVTGTWYIVNSSNGSTRTQQWGNQSQGDVPVNGDFDGDGKTDIAVWRTVNGTWYLINSSNGLQRNQQWGASGDVPTAADFDGDGKSDMAVWRPSNGTWYIINSSNSSTRNQQWGSQSQGDVAIPAFQK